ncbi:helix-turn-helix domain-containing protein [Secundilactobacillus kimchicus]|uniref:helix-turn-helix domain-containing protein n=1 Tax=Secundilactobacillus kimchicus TaxID=528209 RepID=UPI0024A8EF2B|nr:helix-turn-helix transcriptional regulator [Secundilactobacillus kimchicus]
MMKNVTIIANLRRQKGWTQEVLAAKCGLSVRTIQRLESGEDANLETLNLVANALDVKIGDLFESISDQGKEQAIVNRDLNQKEQIAQRKTAQNLYTIAKIIFVLIMLGITPRGASAFGLLWVFMWPIGFILLRAFNKLWFAPTLDRKYPLTKGLDIKRRSRAMKVDPNDGKEQE